MPEVPDDPGSHGLILEGVDFAYSAETPVLRSVSLDVPAGSVRALLGPSGCGKTTLLRVVAGLERPSAGVVTAANGRVLTDATAGTSVDLADRGVAMVFQNWALFPHMTVAQNISFGMTREVRSSGSRLAETVSLVGLEGLEDRRPGELSGGQQQRVALGRALAQRPEVLLLDEPFSNLDPTLRSRVRTEVRELLASLGVTTLLVTHDREEAFVLGDSVTVLRDGSVVAEGPPTELYRNPPDRWSAEFLGEAVLLAGRVRSDGLVDTALGALEWIGPVELPTAPVTVMIRPEMLALASSPPDPAGADGATTGAVVVSVRYSGQLTSYEVDLGARTLRVTEVGPPTHTPGSPVNVIAPTEPVILWSAAQDS